MSSLKLMTYHSSCLGSNKHCDWGSSRCQRRTRLTWTQCSLKQMRICTSLRSRTLLLSDSSMTKSLIAQRYKTYCLSTLKSVASSMSSCQSFQLRLHLLNQSRLRSLSRRLIMSRSFSSSRRAWHMPSRCVMMRSSACIMNWTTWSTCDRW